MTSLLLGLRLLLGAGRGNRVRFALMAIGGSVGVCCLAVVLSIPGILAAQDGRMAARESIQPRKADGRLIDDGHPLILVLPDAYGARPLVRVFIAPGSRKVEPPPGLKALPRPGQVFVSPRLRELIRERRGLEQRFPGRQAGVIEADGLARPGELIGYVGVDRADLPGGLPFKGFGSRYPPTETVEPGTLDIVRFTMAGVVLLPLAVFLSVCARLSAAERARRLAALRLLGMSAKATQRVNAVETVAAAVVGSAVGLGEYWLLNQLVSRVGLPGFTWYPADGALSSTTLAVCLVGCPMLAWFVGRAGARRAASDPLAVRRSAVDAPPSRWGFLPLLAGTGIAAGYCVAGATGHAPRETSVSSVLIPLAVILIGIGLAASLPALSRFVARRTAGSTESLSLGLAMRRNEVEPGGALRVATGSCCSSSRRPSSRGCSSNWTRSPGTPPRCRSTTSITRRSTRPSGARSRACPTSESASSTCSRTAATTPGPRRPRHSWQRATRCARRFCGSVSASTVDRRDCGTPVRSRTRSSAPETPSATRS